MESVIKIEGIRQYPEYKQIITGSQVMSVIVGHKTRIQYNPITEEGNNNIIIKPNDIIVIENGNNIISDRKKAI